MEYRQINNQVQQETRRAVISHEKLIAKNVKTNPKIFWKYVQSKTKTATSIRNLYINKEKTKEIKTDKQKAMVLAKFFNSVFTMEHEGGVPNIEVKDIPMLTQM